MICTIPNCERRLLARGWCAMHYQRWWAHGDPLREPLTTQQRFWMKVAKKETGCWLWCGARLSTGYGQFGGGNASPSGTALAHRIAYELLVGPIPPGLHLDHLCRDLRCVNPAHLEPVTPAENTRRGLHGALRKECRHGHLLAAENITLRRSDNSRRCKTCTRNERRRQLDSQRRAGKSCGETADGTCQVCGRAYTVRRSGNLYRHSVDGSRYGTTCAGSGKPPAQKAAWGAVA